MEISSSSLTPILPSDMLSSSAAMTGGSQQERVKQVCKAMEGLFAGQLMAELGKGLGSPAESQETGLDQDFIQQAMAQQVTAGGGFGLAKVLESSLNPVKPHLPISTVTDTSHHAQLHH